MIKRHKLYRLMIATKGTHKCYTFDDATPVSNVLSLQALLAKTNKTKTPKSRHHGGTDLADMGFSWEEETTGPAQPIGQAGHLPYHFFPATKIIINNFHQLISFVK